jgi:hypothetical protein
MDGSAMVDPESFTRVLLFAERHGSKFVVGYATERRPMACVPSVKINMREKFMKSFAKIAITLPLAAVLLAANPGSAQASEKWTYGLVGFGLGALAGSAASQPYYGGGYYSGGYYPNYYSSYSYPSSYYTSSYYYPQSYYSSYYSYPSYSYPAYGGYYGGGYYGGGYYRGGTGISVGLGW